MQLLYFGWLALSTSVVLSPVFPFLRDIGRYGKLTGNGSGCQVLTKVAFTSYYGWASVCVMILLANLVSVAHYEGSPPVLLRALCVLDPAPEREFSVNRFHAGVVCLLLYLIHLLRRFLECLFVTRFSGSKQHLIITAAALVYYSLAAATPALESGVCSLMDAPRWQGPARSRSGVGFAPLQLLLGLDSAQALGLFIFASASVVQYQSHRILAALRSPRQGKPGLPPKYQIPRGGMFEVVSCPHYLAEVLIYIALFFVAGGTMGQLLVVLWVVCNLTMTASRTHRWYKQRFDNYPANRFRIFPGIY